MAPVCLYRVIWHLYACIELYGTGIESYGTCIESYGTCIESYGTYMPRYRQMAPVPYNSIQAYRCHMIIYRHTGAI